MSIFTCARQLKALPAFFTVSRPGVRVLNKVTELKILFSALLPNALDAVAHMS